MLTNLDWLQLFINHVTSCCRCHVTHAVCPLCRCGFRIVERSGANERTPRKDLVAQLTTLILRRAAVIPFHRTNLNVANKNVSPRNERNKKNVNVVKTFVNLPLICHRPPHRSFRIPRCPVQSIVARPQKTRLVPRQPTPRTLPQLLTSATPGTIRRQRILTLIQKVEVTVGL